MFYVVPGRLLTQVQATTFGDFSFTTQANSWLLKLIIKIATSIKLSCIYIVPILDSIVKQIAHLWEKEIFVG